MTDYESSPSKCLSYQGAGSLHSFSHHTGSNSSPLVTSRLSSSSSHQQQHQQSQQAAVVLSGHRKRASSSGFQKITVSILDSSAHGMSDQQQSQASTRPRSTPNQGTSISPVLASPVCTQKNSPAKPNFNPFISKRSPVAVRQLPYSFTSTSSIPISPGGPPPSVRAILPPHPLPYSIAGVHVSSSSCNPFSVRVLNSERAMVTQGKKKTGEEFETNVNDLCLLVDHSAIRKDLTRVALRLEAQSLVQGKWLDPDSPPLPEGRAVELLRQQIRNIILKGETECESKEAFVFFTVGASDYIDYRSWFHTLTLLKLEQCFREKDVWMLFESADPDANGRIGWSEFCKYIVGVNL